MKFEIEIISDHPGSEIFDLKEFLIDHDMQSFKVKLKEGEPVDGEMSIALTAAIVVGEKLLDMAVDKCFGILLEDKVKAWLDKRGKTSDPNIEIVTSIISDNKKIHYVTNNKGESKLINQNFTLNANQTTAIIIGNGTFDGNFPAIEPVKGNIEQMFKIFSDKRIFNIPTENIKILSNKSNFEIEEELLKATKKNNTETLIIYFAGHGYRAGIDKLFLITKNSIKIDDYIVGGLDFDFIKDVVLKNSTANNKILLLDACHSGIATQNGDHDDLINSAGIKGSYILASSAADQVSYYHADHPTTYFTNEFLHVISNGRLNDKEWLSIDDVFETLAHNLSEKKLPLPRSKSDLSIPTSHFFIANNVRYNLNSIVENTKSLIKEGRLEEALKALNDLHLKYPTDTLIMSLYDKTKNELLFNNYVHAGDEYLFVKNDCHNALKAYSNAILIKNEYTILVKIEKCKKIISENVAGNQIQVESQPNKVNDKIPTPSEQQLEVRTLSPNLSDHHTKVYTVSEEYPKKIAKSQIIFTYVAVFSVFIFPLATIVFLILSPYAIINGGRWWLLKINFQGKLIHKYDDTTQKNGKIIFIFGMISWLLLVIFYFIGINRLQNAQ